MIELEALPQTAWNHPSASKSLVAALAVLEEGTVNRDFLPDFREEGEVIASWGWGEVDQIVGIGRLDLMGGLGEERAEVEGSGC